MINQFMKIWSYVILSLILVLLIVTFLKLNKVEYHVEHPKTIICSNGIVIDENMKQKMLNFANDYIENYVGAQYFKDHFYYQNYYIENCQMKVNYLYVVNSQKINIYVNVLPGAILSVLDSNAPKYPFEINYGPSDFNIKYDNYVIDYDKNEGFIYTFYDNGRIVGYGDAQSGKLIKEAVVV